MSDHNSDESFVKPEYPKSVITSRIIATAQQVHRGLGPGYEELIYQRALALELAAEGLDFSREVWIDVHYNGQVIGKKQVDFVIEGAMLEIKARSQPGAIDMQAKAPDIHELAGGKIIPPIGLCGDDLVGCSSHGEHKDAHDQPGKDANKSFEK